MNPTKIPVKTQDSNTELTSTQQDGQMKVTGFVPQRSDSSEMVTVCSTARQRSDYTKDSQKRERK